MNAWASGQEEFSDYITSKNFLWFYIVSGILVLIAMAMFICVSPYACFRNCCKDCKIDFNRTDYEKH